MKLGDVAGVCLNGSLKDTSLSDFTEQMNVNFFGAVAMTKGEHSVPAWCHPHCKTTRALLWTALTGSQSRAMKGMLVSAG